MKKIIAIVVLMVLAITAISQKTKYPPVKLLAKYESSNMTYYQNPGYKSRDYSNVDEANIDKYKYIGAFVTGTTLRFIEVGNGAKYVIFLHYPTGKAIQFEWVVDKPDIDNSPSSEDVEYTSTLKIQPVKQYTNLDKAEKYHTEEPFINISGLVTMIHRKDGELDIMVYIEKTGIFLLHDTKMTTEDEQVSGN